MRPLVILGRVCVSFGVLYLCWIWGYGKIHLFINLSRLWEFLFPCWIWLYETWNHIVSCPVPFPLERSDGTCFQVVLLSINLARLCKFLFLHIKLEPVLRVLFRSLPTITPWWGLCSSCPSVYKLDSSLKVLVSYVLLNLSDDWNRTQRNRLMNFRLSKQCKLNRVWVSSLAEFLNP